MQEAFIIIGSDFGISTFVDIKSKKVSIFVIFIIFQVKFKQMNLMFILKIN